MKKEVYELVATQTNDTILERKVCGLTGEKFPVYVQDQVMLDKLSPRYGDTVYQLPRPIHEPSTRMIQRLAVRNNRFLYKRTCALTGKSIISLYSSDKPYTVYSHAAWNSDARDPCAYGRSYDVTKSFFEQFAELQKDVPRIATAVDVSAVNCEYANGVTNAKNCYLSDTCSWNEDIRYCSWVISGSQVMDCYKCEHIEQSYACVLCQRSSGLQYCVDCYDSNQCFYSVNLRNCHHCFGCHDLAHKSYCVYNEQFTKEAYESFIAAQALSSARWRKVQYARFLKEVWGKTVHPTLQLAGSNKSIGNNVTDSDHCFLCYDLIGGKDCRYCTDFSPTGIDCLDCSYSGREVSRNYFTFSGLGHNLLCCMFVRNSSDCMYCDSCRNCTFCFGCVGLSNKEYCIFNTQYTKEEYFVLRDQIIRSLQARDEWGRFFTPACVPFGYNETVAYEYIQLTKEEALARGYAWQDHVPGINLPEGVTPLSAQNLPDDTAHIGDDIVGKVLICETSGKPYRCIPSEIAFYRKYKLPIPREHYDVRYEQKKMFVAPRELVLRTDTAGKTMLSVYDETSAHSGTIVSPEQYEQMMFG